MPRFTLGIRLGFLLAFLYSVAVVQGLHAQIPIRAALHRGAGFILVSEEDRNGGGATHRVYFPNGGRGEQENWQSVTMFQESRDVSGSDEDDRVEVPAVSADTFTRVRNNLTIDEFLFGATTSTRLTEERLYKVLAEKIASIDRKCELTDLQKRKLELAGRGDVARLFGRVDRVRTVFSRCQKTWTVAQIQEWAADIAVERERLNRDLDSEPFGRGSLFSKVLTPVLTPYQVVLFFAGDDS